MRDLEWLKSEVDELHIEGNMDLEYVSGYIDAKIDILELIEEVEFREYVSTFNDGYKKGYERGTLE